METTKTTKTLVPVTAVPESAVLKTVASNPKRPGSKAHAHYELYRVGLTVGKWLEECKAKGLDVGYAKAGVLWDARHAFVTYDEPKAVEAADVAAAAALGRAAAARVVAAGGHLPPAKK
jgi:hypothetical protein